MQKILEKDLTVLLQGPEDQFFRKFPEVPDKDLRGPVSKPKGLFADFFFSEHDFSMPRWPTQKEFQPATPSRTSGKPLDYPEILEVQWFSRSS